MICFSRPSVKAYDSGVDRDDLAALFSRIAVKLRAAEEPILAAHDLSMWEYITLYRLAGRPAASQATLAQSVGYDKTRIISVLDKLQAEGLIDRQPDPADRRAHLVQITPAGSARHAAAQADIRTVEETLLRTIGPEQRRSLLDILPRLATEPCP